MPLREFIEKNFWWKLASIMSAGLIWFTIYYSSIEGKVIPSKNRAEENSALIFPLPIKVMSSAGEARGFVVTPPDADVTVRGEPAVLDELKKTDVRVYVELDDAKETRAVRKKVLVHTPENVTLKKVVPEEVTVERIASRPTDQKPD
jgi:YbbR domain-containing protein